MIIKLGALGDVLRTTAICEPLKSLYPGSFIIWITEDSAIPVLSGNRFVDKIIGKSQAFGFVSLFNFDILINLDLDEYALILAGLTKAKEKKGFWFDPDRVIHFSSSSAEEYFTLSHDDFLKKRNKKTYQAFIAEIAGLPYYGKIIVPISSSSREYARNFAEKNGIIDKKIIGAIVGTGNRWITKRWPEKNFIKLFSLLKDFKIITFGGIEEKRLLEWIADKSGKNVISAGYSNTIDQFFGLLDLCDIVVCCDTFALHAAVGLGKKIVALFGPTSAAEIEMYDRGEKIVSDMSCVCCYKRVCEKSPNCMEMIDPEKVAQSVRRLAGEGRKNCSDNSHI
ncbi:MAG: glycosyltransferase family 9 protein [bacterium]|nr:glycosyltransferase family 9 protein [bacterium]